jgi:hypothetical protein
MIKAVAGAVIAIVSVIAGILSVTQEPESPDFNQAKVFLRDYYRDAPDDPDATWNRLSDSFREEKAKDPDNPLTHEEYVEYFGQYDSVTLDGFGVSEQNDGWWRATLVFRTADGEVTRPHFQFELVCPWWSKYPGLSCDTEDIRLNASDYYPKRFWTNVEDER